MPFTTYARSQGRNRFGRRRYGPLVTKGYLKSIIGVPEVKWVNTVLVPTPVDSLGTLYNLNAIALGTTESTRIGNEVSNKSLHLRLDLARGPVDALVRIIILWWKDGNTTTAIAPPSPPTPSTILETVSYQSPLNKTYGKSMWIKFDKTYTIAAGQTQLIVDEIWRKLRCKTEYVEGTATTSQTANSLYLLAISNQSTVANQPLFSFTSRLNYMDV